MMTRMKKSECRRIVREYVERYNPYEKSLHWDIISQKCRDMRERTIGKYQS